MEKKRRFDEQKKETVTERREMLYFSLYIVKIITSANASRTFGDCTFFLERGDQVSQRRAVGDVGDGYGGGFIFRVDQADQNRYPTETKPISSNESSKEMSLSTPVSALTAFRTILSGVALSIATEPETDRLGQNMFWKKFIVFTQRRVR